jgi:uncharacterized membrane protein YraQ (UPF0718 family)
VIGLGSLKAVSARWWFLLAVLVLYGGVALADAETARAALGSFSSLVGRVLPILGLVYVLVFLFNAFAEPQWITRFVGRSSGLKGWMVAVTAGVLSMGPIYPWYALLAEVKDKGMRPSLVAAFLYARAIKLPLLPLLAHYFGWVYTTVLVGYLLVFAVVNGVATGLAAGEEGKGERP